MGTPLGRGGCMYGADGCLLAKRALAEMDGPERDSTEMRNVLAATATDSACPSSPPSPLPTAPPSLPAPSRKAACTSRSGFPRHRQATAPASWPHDREAASAW